MRKLPAIVVLAFALALVAGGVIGVLAAPTFHPRLKQKMMHHLPPPPPPHGGRIHVRLGKDLDLTPAQETQMREIWEATRTEMDEHMRRREAVKREWEAAVQQLFTREQKARFDQLRQEYQARLAAVEGEFESIFRRAEDKTRQLLNEEQRKRFDDILAERRHRPGGPGGPPGKPPTGPPGRPEPDHGPRRGPGWGPGGELRILLEDPGRGPRSRRSFQTTTRRAD